MGYDPVNEVPPVPDIILVVTRYRTFARDNTRKGTEWLRENPHYATFSADERVMQQVEKSLKRRGLIVQVIKR